MTTTTTTTRLTARRSFTSLLLTGLLATALRPAPVASQEAAKAWPTRPVTVIVPYPAGGGVDTVARILTNDLSHRLTQQFLVENKPGAATIIGTQVIAAAQPDGHSFGIVTDSHAINPGYGRSMPYDSAKDFAVVTGLIRVPLVLIVNAGKLKVRSLSELIAEAKRNPGGLTFASLGPGSPHQLAFEWLRTLAGINVRIVPYRGIAPALQDVVGGQVDMMLVGVAVADGFIAEGKVRPIAVTSKTRLSRSPDVPTVAEQGLPDYEIVTWYGAVAPAKVPAPILARLRQEVRRSLDSPDVRRRIEETGAEVYQGSAEDFAAFMAEEAKKYARVIQLTGSKID